MQDSKCLHTQNTTSGSEKSMFETSRLGPKRPYAKRPVTMTSRSEMSRCDTFGSEKSMCELDSFKVHVSVRRESSIKRPLEESMCELPRSRCVLPSSEISGCGDVRVWTVQTGCDLNITPGWFKFNLETQKIRISTSKTPNRPNRWWFKLNSETLHNPGQDSWFREIYMKETGSLWDALVC